MSGFSVWFADGSGKWINWWWRILQLPISYTGSWSIVQHRHIGISGGYSTHANLIGLGLLQGLPDQFARPLPPLLFCSALLCSTTRLQTVPGVSCVRKTEWIRLLVRAYGPHANMYVVQAIYQMLVPLTCDMVAITDCCDLSYWFGKSF